jgi:hypothetical protein
MIIAYGGSRADEPGRQKPRFPASAEDALFTRVRGLIQSLKPQRLVGALASGADIVFACAALAEQVPLHVVLPFDAATFRATSVELAGQPWIDHYDRIVSTSHVTIENAHLDPDDVDVYRQHNIVILDEAERLAAGDRARVWLMTIRPKPQQSSPTVTDDLVARAEERGMLAIDFDPMPDEPPSAFVVMPYGRKKDPRANRYLECDPAFHRVYRPLLEDFDLRWTRADLQTDSGIIHSSMLLDLANSDLVLADLSAINFNVAYEIGIRHVFASRATVLVDPQITSFKRPTPPFDINMIRMHSFGRGSDDITDEQAKAAIVTLRPVVEEALKMAKSDSPAHEWFRLDHVVRPFQPRSTEPQRHRAEADMRQGVADALRSADPYAMRGQATKLAAAADMSDSTRRALRIELATGLLAEGDYDDARELLERAKPAPEDPLHRAWLRATVMAYRRLGEESRHPPVQREYWDAAARYLVEAQEAGYRDSETYGMWGGLLKRQLQTQRAQMDKAVAQSLFAEMEQKYRSGFELDPTYYTGVNLVMALRWSGRPRDGAFDREFTEVLTVSRFLARTALTEESGDFWAIATLAELALHEALERKAPIDEAVRLYADAARIGRPDELGSLRFQLEFLRACGDPPEQIGRVLDAVGQAD